MVRLSLSENLGSWLLASLCALSLGCAKSKFDGAATPQPTAEKNPNQAANTQLQGDAFGDGSNDPNMQPRGDFNTGTSTIPVIKVCSDRQTESNGTNVVSAQGVSVKLADATGKQYRVQSDPTQNKTSIRFQSSVSATISGVPDGQYLALFCDVQYEAGCGAGATASSVVEEAATTNNRNRRNRANRQNTGSRFGSLGAGPVTVQGGQIIASSPIRLTYFINPRNAQMMNMFQGMFTGMMSQAGGAANPMAQMMGAMMPKSYNPTQQQIAIAQECQDEASPLMVDLSDNLGITFGHQDNGIDFDIDGDGEKDRISWFTHTKVGILSIDLDEDGLISSVHEMFGNNTKGPDEALAANGFEALAKFDSNSDRKIDSHDTIFSLLKLWVDEDLDGISQAHELHSLSDLGIKSIALDYSVDLEVDRYGNQSKERSRVLMEDGREKTMIDVWFLPSIENKS